MLDLSVLIIACNEERIIGKTLAAAASLASEIIVVDSGSTDKTLEIAKQYNAQCHHQQWLGYAAQKNYALSLASKSWILSLDADEIISDDLAKEIITLLSTPSSKSSGNDDLSQVPSIHAETGRLSQSPSIHPATGHFSPTASIHSETGSSVQVQLYDGYKIPRLLYIAGKALKHGGFYPDAQLRLFQNGKGKFLERKVHESVQVKGPVGRLHSPLLHYSYNDFVEYSATLDRYARLSAEEFFSKENKKSDEKQTNNKSLEKSWRASKINEIIHPIWTFTYRYFLRAGFLDGANGLKANLIYQDYVRKKIKYLRELY